MVLDSNSFESAKGFKKMPNKCVTVNRVVRTVIYIYKNETADQLLSIKMWAKGIAKTLLFKILPKYPFWSDDKFRLLKLSFGMEL